MNEILCQHKMQSVEKDALKVWTEDMNACKWHNHGQISHDLYDVSWRKTLSESTPAEGKGTMHQIK